MKKTFIATAFLCLFAGMASAVTFNWNATAVTFEGTKFNKTTGASVVGYLIYLGGEGSTLSASYALAEGDTGESVASKIAGKNGTVVTSQTGTTAVGKLNNNYTFDLGTDYSNGDVFAMLISYSKEGKTYFNLSTSQISMANATSDPPVNPDAANFEFSWSGPKESSTIAKGGGWTVVPEPSTAALALAGLALLLKRRKA